MPYPRESSTGVQAILVSKEAIINKALVEQKMSGWTRGVVHAYCVSG